MKKSNNTRDPSENELQELQTRIEDLTNKFEESSLLKDTPNLIKLLIRQDVINAKIYLYKNIPQDIYNSTIAQFGEYTLEAIIIYICPRGGVPQYSRVLDCEGLYIVGTSRENSSNTGKYNQ